MIIAIRPEIPADYAEVFEVNQLAFGQDGEALLVDALRKSEAFVPSLSLVAVLENSIVGHILFTKIKIENVHGNLFDSLALAPMAVHPKFQKQGIGTQLIKTGLYKAKALGFESVIVLGHEQYYPKFGFVPAARWNIRAPFEVPEDVFMGIELVQDALKNVSGTVLYPKEFENV